MSMTPEDYQREAEDAETEEWGRCPDCKEPIPIDRLGRCLDGCSNCRRADLAGLTEPGHDRPALAKSSPPGGAPAYSADSCPNCEREPCQCVSEPLNQWYCYDCRRPAVLDANNHPIDCVCKAEPEHFSFQRERYAAVCGSAAIAAGVVAGSEFIEREVCPHLPADAVEPFRTNFYEEMGRMAAESFIAARNEQEAAYNRSREGGDS